MPFKDYRQTSQYGWRVHPIHKTRKFHAGVDLVKSHKAPINAFTSGTVIYAGLGTKGSGVGGYGNVVIVKDIKGAAHVYAHLDTVDVRKGTVVKKGQVIGRQGATGQVTGSHLHYEVRKKSSPSLGWTVKAENSTHDPVKYLKSLEVKLKIDGYLGKLTITELQLFSGVKADGLLGPVTIKALQKWLGVKVDGDWGPITTTALQRKLGTVVDGKISRPSLVIKELQRRLNKGDLR